MQALLTASGTEILAPWYQKGKEQSYSREYIIADYHFAGPTGKLLSSFQRYPDALECCMIHLDH